ncbi:MAG: hypothetical protein HUU50_14200, partial [Candidatus Brocadiae bacterium]|nr:hypothetical protein [Candidatus Brocadiia bacterium]
MLCKKIFQSLLVLWVLFTGSSFAEAKKVEKKATETTKKQKNTISKKIVRSTGRIHWHSDRYIFKDDKNEKVYILLENDVLGKWIQNVNPLAIYEIEGNVYSFQQNRYLSPTKYECKKTVAAQTLPMGEVSEKKLLRTKNIKNLASQKKKNAKKEVDKSKDKSKK